MARLCFVPEDRKMTIEITLYVVDGPLGSIPFAYEHIAQKYAAECNTVVRVEKKMWSSK